MSSRLGGQPMMKRHARRNLQRALGSNSSTWKSRHSTGASVTALSTHETLCVLCPAVLFFLDSESGDCAATLVGPEQLVQGILGHQALHVCISLHLHLAHTSTTTKSFLRCTRGEQLHF